MLGRYHGVGRCIASDLFRLCGSSTFRDMGIMYLKNKSFRYMVAFRIAQRGGVIGKVLWITRPRCGIDIGLGATIGEGLYIGHNGPVVINGTAKIGSNCNLSQFTTIGSNHEHAATVGDNVYIGPGVCIVEDVHIGSGATIGAGSVVVHDVPENATVAGNPARVLNYRCPGRFIKNPCRVNGVEG